MGGEEADPLAAVEAEEDVAEEASLSQERYAELSALEQFILTVSINGYGKRTSSYEYRVTGRGGKGILTIQYDARRGTLVGAVVVDEESGAGHRASSPEKGQLHGITLLIPNPRRLAERRQD
jgi:DNA gyrase subunit A